MTEIPYARRPNKIPTPLFEASFLLDAFTPIASMAPADFFERSTKPAAQQASPPGKGNRWKDAPLAGSYGS